jgi:hypothetical protein
MGNLTQPRSGTSMTTFSAELKCFAASACPSKANDERKSGSILFDLTILTVVKKVVRDPLVFLDHDLDSRDDL